MPGETFSDCVQGYLRKNGNTQKELAKAIGLSEKVLSRKMHQSGDSRLNNQNVRDIITRMAEWRAITTRGEALHLLELADMKSNCFSSQDWQMPPLSQLEQEPEPAQPDPLSISNHLLTPTPRHNLPASTTRLIGRDRAVERIRLLLERDEVRVVTLTGPGGRGKTRLALQVASELLDVYPHGVWYVSLAAVTDPNLIPISIIQALGLTFSSTLSPLHSLVEYLRDKQTLLVLDNFDQVVRGASIVGEVLAASPLLKIVVTSQVLPHLYGESQFDVPPLDLPPQGKTLPGVEDLAQYGAIQLFLERIQAVLPDFTLTAENGATIAQICAKLDGLPLALELAAPRMKLMSPADLLEHLSESRFLILTGGASNLPDRQKTLHATVQWSYNFLSEEEQRWFPYLGVFVGGWTLEDTAAMMQSKKVGSVSNNGPHSGTRAYLFATSPVTPSVTLTANSTVDVLDLLQQLVDKNLVVRHSASDGGHVRFTMLETLCEFALERLAERGELEKQWDWHASYYLSMAEKANLGLRGSGQLASLEQLEREQSNIRTALRWLLQRVQTESRDAVSFDAIRASQSIIQAPAKDAMVSEEEVSSHVGSPTIELLLRFVAALSFYWEWQGYIPEGWSWLQEALHAPFPDDAGATLLMARARALEGASRLMYYANDQVKAVALIDEGIALWRRLPEGDGLAKALHCRGWLAQTQDDTTLARQYFDRSLALLTPTSSPGLRGQLFLCMGATALLVVDLEQTQAYLTESRNLFEQVGDERGVAEVLYNWAGCFILQGKFEEALTYLLEALDLSAKLNYQGILAYSVGMIGFAIGLRGEPERVEASTQAAQLVGAAEALLRATGIIPWIITNPMVKTLLQSLSEQAGKERWEQAWNEGQSLTLTQALSLARQLARAQLVRA